MKHLKKYCCDIHQKQPIQFNKFEIFDVKKVQKAAVKIQGGSRPSGMDVNDCKRMLTSKQFGKSSFDLCKMFSEVF